MNRATMMNRPETTVCLLLRDRTEPTLQKAYRSLRYNTRLRANFKRYAAHRASQGAVMSGRILLEGPDGVITAVVNDLCSPSSGWQLGTAADVEAERAEIAVRVATLQAREVAS